jgi:hypothetical protein
VRRRRRDAEEPRLVDPDLVDRLIAEAREQGVDVAGEGGLFAQLAKTVLERSLAAELTDHLGYEEGDPAGVGSSNSRNGYTPKKLGTEVGVLDLQVPRDRNGSFEPQTVRKGQRRREGIDNLVIGLYGRGLTLSAIRAQLKETFDLSTEPEPHSTRSGPYTDNLTGPLDREGHRRACDCPGARASTVEISRELRRNAATRGGKLEYRASVAQWKADLIAHRPKTAKLAANERLRDYVQDRLAAQVRRRDGTPVPGPATVWKGLDKPHRRDRRWVTRWSPEQISHRLKLDYPDDESMRISHAQPPHLCAELVRQRRGCGPGSERRLDSHVDRPTEAVMIRHVR